MIKLNNGDYIIGFDNGVLPLGMVEPSYDTTKRSRQSFKSAGFLECSVIIVRFLK